MHLYESRKYEPSKSVEGLANEYNVTKSLLQAL